MLVRYSSIWLRGTLIYHTLLGAGEIESLAMTVEDLNAQLQQSLSLPLKQEVVPPASVSTENDSLAGKPHPSFNALDADIILCSSDNVFFRIHSLILTIASGWFSTLLSLPHCPPSYKQSSSPPPSPPPEVIHMVEDAKVIAGLLSMAGGRELPKIDTFEYLEDLLHTAEKYDMPGVLSILRLAIMSPKFLDTHPVRVYAIACQWGWVEEAKLASTKTLGIDLLGHDTVKDLGIVESPHLTALMLLHRRRRDVLRTGLDSHTSFYANNVPGRCSHCQREIAHVGWMHLKHVWSNAIEQHPGDIVSGAVLQEPELHEMLGAVCQHCQRKLYNAEGTMTKLKQLLDKLPTTVEASNATFACSCEARLTCMWQL